VLDEYEALTKSKYAQEMRTVRVRIDITRFSMSRQYLWPRVRGITFEEIGLEACIQKLVPSAEKLCKALKTCAPSSKVVEIDWVDDFGEAVHGTSLQMRASVLVLFTSLEGAKCQLGR
jgi:hypothetical protein